MQMIRENKNLEAVRERERERERESYTLNNKSEVLFESQTNSDNYIDININKTRLNL